jgi:hypothetical protein
MKWGVGFQYQKLLDKFYFMSMNFVIKCLQISLSSRTFIETLINKVYILSRYKKKIIYSSLQFVPLLLIDSSANNTLVTVRTECKEK